MRGLLRLGATQEALLNEALDMLLAAHRERQQGEAKTGILAGLHDVMRPVRTMIEDLDYIRFTTCTADSILYDLGIEGNALELLSGHYEKIYQSSERALAAAGFGPALVHVIESDEETTGAALKVRPKPI